MDRINLTKTARCLRLDGMGAYRIIMIEYAERINQLQEQVEELQNQLSAEIMARIAPPADLQEIVKAAATTVEEAIERMKLCDCGVWLSGTPWFRCPWCNRLVLQTSLKEEN